MKYEEIFINNYEEKIKAEEREKVLDEVRLGINNIINEYAIDGKVLTCLITEYLESKCDWLKST